MWGSRAPVRPKASPEQYDVVLPTSGWFENYAKAQLLTPLEPDRLTGLTDIKLGFDWKKPTTVDDKMYGVLYNWGTQPLAWIDGSIPKDGSVDQYLDGNGNPNDWNILWDPAFKGKVSIFRRPHLRPADDSTGPGHEGSIPPHRRRTHARVQRRKKDAVYKFINETLKVPCQARFIATSGNNGTLDMAQATSSDAKAAGLVKTKLDGTLIPATAQGERLWSKLIFFQAVENLNRRLDMWNKFKLGTS